MSVNLQNIAGQLAQAQAALAAMMNADKPAADTSRPITDKIYDRLRYFCGTSKAAQMMLWRNVCMLKGEPEAYLDEELDICLRILNELEVH